MAARNIVESTIQLIKKQLKDNMPQALIDIRVDRVDAAVTTEPPRDYFIYTPAIGYKAPCIFVIADGVDFKLSRGQNHINATVRTFVSCVVEDKTAEMLELKCFRYHDAIHHLLDNQDLIDSARKIKIITKVISSDFGQGTKQQSTVDSIFRKEFMFTLEAEHFEMNK